MFSSTISDYFSLNKTNGEIGIEIEMEGRGLARAIPNSLWLAKKDGSLRGEAIEYVLSKPINRKDVLEYLTSLQNYLHNVGSRLVPSDRCGVHIHLNVQNLEIKKVVQIVVLYIILEDLLVKWCGPEREGNSFCLRVKDAEYLIDDTCQQILDGQLNPTDNVRYASINLTALSRFGSLEFRAMRTEKDFTRIKTWIDMLLRVKDHAIKYNSPEDIVEAVSMNGATPFVRQVMGQLSELIECPDMDQLVFDGVRRAQVLAYTRPPARKKKESNLEDIILRHMQNAPDDPAPPPQFEDEAAVLRNIAAGLRGA